MSIAYPIVNVSVTAVIALEAYRVSVGSVWTTGNLLFRASSCGRDLLASRKRWAHAVDRTGRAYILYPTDRPKARGLVIQPLDSRYCFEVVPATPHMALERHSSDRKPDIHES
jgi:hypothetical protein